MTQQVINVGAAPNDGTGNTIRQSFTICNSNFSELYSRAQTSVPPTLVGSVGDSVGMYASDSSYFYYCFANYDGSSIIWGQVTDAGNPTGSHIVNGNSNVDIATANGNVSVAVTGTSNVLVFANTGAYVTGLVSATGNVTGNYFIGNGSQLTGIATSSYSDSNVATLLGAFGSNTISTTGSITSGNVTGDYIIGNGSALTSITGANVTGTVANATYAVSSGTATSATTAATVTTAAQPNITSVGTLTVLSSSGNITGGNVLTGGIISATGDITGGNISATTHTGTTVSVTGTVTSASVVGGIITGTSASVSGTVTAASVVGGVMTGTSTSVLGNVTGGNILTGGIISSTGNATVGNLITGGLVSATGNINGGGMTINGNGVVTGNLQIQGNLIYNNLTNITTSNLVFGLANTTTGISANGAGFVVGNTAEASFLYNYSAQAWNSNIGISAVGNITGGNILTAGLVTATGNVTGGNILTAGLVTATGNVTGGNILTAGLVTATGNVTGGNILTAGLVTATGNVTGGNILTAGLVTATGNVTGGNVRTAGLVTATGNVTGGNLISNQDIFATGILTLDQTFVDPAAVKMRILVDGDTSFIQVGNGVAASSGNLAFARWFDGIGSVVINTDSGNINAGNVLTSGVISATGNVTGGNVRTAGLVTATGNVTGGNIIGNTAVFIGTRSIQNPPTFSATGGGNTVITGAFVQAQVAYATEIIDTDNWFASNRYTPQLAGYYQINCGARIFLTGGVSNAEAGLVLRKNGGTGGVAHNGGFGAVTGSTSQLVYLNGSTDYVDVAIFNSQTGNVGQFSGYTYFSGVWLRP
jgi:hypothetical protein